MGNTNESLLMLPYVQSSHIQPLGAASPHRVLMSNEVVAPSSAPSAQQPQPPSSVLKRKRTRKPNTTKKFALDPEPSPPRTDLTYRDYNPYINLMNYRLVDLKKLAKFNRLKVTATKPQLVDRIHRFFIQHICATKIQKYLRRFFVLRSFRLRGPAYGQLNLCVNETDFFTLEPLSEIPKQDFFSYSVTQGESTFCYGFNINSLIHLLKRKGTLITNPYNREALPELVVGDIIRLYLYMIMFFPSHVDQEDNVPPYERHLFLQPVKYSQFLRGCYYGFPRPAPVVDRSRVPLPTTPPPQRRRILPPTIRTDDSPPPQATTVPVPPGAPRRLRRGQHLGTSDDNRDLPTPFPFLDDEDDDESVESRDSGDDDAASVDALPGAIVLNHIDSMMHQLEQLRRNPLPMRIQELFIEMDQLGNYTDMSWFHLLTKRECFILYGHLFENWRYRSRLLPHVKMRICPLGDPFHGVMPRRMRIDDVTDLQLRTGCITVMENMVYTAMDIEDRKLGTLHVLTALTSVSLGARVALPWLFDAMY